MFTHKQLAVVCGLALTLLAGVATQAQASDTRYAVVSFSNPTGHTIHYSFQWGEYGEWKQFTLYPGESRWHAWEYEYANQNHSPVPRIKFDADLTSDHDFEIYRVEAYAAPQRGTTYAKRYAFATAGHDYLRLVEVN
jgi:hypothetical protein